MFQLTTTKKAKGQQTIVRHIKVTYTTYRQILQPGKDYIRLAAVLLQDVAISVSQRQGGEHLHIVEHKNRDYVPNGQSIKKRSHR